MSGAYSEVTADDARDVDEDSKHAVIDTVITATNIEKMNVTSGLDQAWHLYMFDKPHNYRFVFKGYTAADLDYWDASANDSILVARTDDTLYNLGFGDNKKVVRYHAIGGDGGPFIGVSVSHNDADPMGEFFKCASAGRDVVEIISWDGVRFCFPKQVIHWDNQFSGVKTWPAYPDMPEEYSLWGWLAREMATELRPDNPRENGFLAMSDVYITRKNKILIEDHGFTDDEAILEFRHGLIPAPSLLADAMSTDSDGSVLFSTRVPWEARHISSFSGINTLNIFYGTNNYTTWLMSEAANEDFRRRINFFIGQVKSDYGYVSSTIDWGVPHLTDFGPLSQYELDVLATEYAASQPARENEYEVVYGELEKNALLNQFNMPSDIGFFLNNIYMGDAQFLVSTYIQSVYTFKTVEMPALTPERFSPESLSAQESSVFINEYTVESTPYDPGDYYRIEYGDGEVYPSPALPDSKFVMARGYADLAVKTEEMMIELYHSTKEDYGTLPGEEYAPSDDPTGGDGGSY